MSMWKHGDQFTLLTHSGVHDALQRLVDQVLEVAVKPVHSYSRTAATARQLAGITAAAVKRYAAHLHSAATGLLRVSQVVLAPSSVVQSGKTTRHRRGESVGSPAASRCGSFELASCNMSAADSNGAAGLMGMLMCSMVVLMVHCAFAVHACCGANAVLLIRVSSLRPTLASGWRAFCKHILAGKAAYWPLPSMAAPHQPCQQAFGIALSQQAQQAAAAASCLPQQLLCSWIGKLLLLGRTCYEHPVCQLCGATR
jgi:hypothetical protein